MFNQTFQTTKVFKLSKDSFKTLSLYIEADQSSVNHKVGNSELVLYKNSSKTRASSKASIASRL
jgi:hypothetical protein